MRTYICERTPTIIIYYVPRRICFTLEGLSGFYSSTRFVRYTRARIILRRLTPYRYCVFLIRKCTYSGYISSFPFRFFLFYKKKNSVAVSINRTYSPNERRRMFTVQSGLVHYIAIIVNERRQAAPNEPNRPPPLTVRRPNVRDGRRGPVYFLPVVMRSGPRKFENG